ncbi:MAG: hypothetical protein ACLUSP_01810 [Christensenellales bacterium]
MGGVKTALNRCCTERFSPDNGYCYDYAAVGRADKKGIILCWLRQEEASVAGAATSIRTTLTGYNDTSNVLVVVTDGTGVIASNAAEYIGQPTSECIFTAGTDKPYGTLSRVKNGASVYYGMRAKTKTTTYTCFIRAATYTRCVPLRLSSCFCLWRLGFWRL